MTALFGVSIMLQRNDIADVAWGPGIAIATLMALIQHPTPGIGMWILGILVCIWALRLGIRIGLRNMKKPEDPRYAQWRQEWGRWFTVRSFLQVFVLQGALMVVMAAPFLVLAYTGMTVSVLSLVFVIGIVVWAVGFWFEVVGDYQLDRFLAQARAPGAILTSGLWRYSRHPNYFGEVTLWWGLWVATLGMASSLWGVVSPLLITYLILKVSGIPMSEKLFEGNEAFEVYKRHTSMFIPLPSSAPK